LVYFQLRCVCHFSRLSAVTDKGSLKNCYVLGLRALSKNPGLVLMVRVVREMGFAFYCSVMNFFGMNPFKVHNWQCILTQVTDPRYLYLSME
jgi:hypothetical protein